MWNLHNIVYRVCDSNKVTVPRKLQVENVKLTDLIKQFLVYMQFKYTIQCSTILSLHKALNQPLCGYSCHAKGPNFHCTRNISWYFTFAAVISSHSPDFQPLESRLSTFHYGLCNAFSSICNFRSPNGMITRHLLKIHYYYYYYYYYYYFTNTLHP
jgi:hypothetical protein